MSGNDLYHNAPLDTNEDEIRLLRIDLSPVKYRLQKISLRHRVPQYVALSYCWGEQADQQELHVDDKSILISSTLSNALEHVIAFWRSTYATSGKPLLLWCDQICIDQGNNEEKNHQVAYMGHIFANAEEVLVSLTTAKAVTCPVRPVLMDAPRPLPISWSSWTAWHLNQLQQQNRSQYHAVPPPQYVERAQQDLEAQRAAPGAVQSFKDILQACDNIQAIMESPWWQRAWIFQEFMLANRATFLLSHMWFPWHDVYSLIKAYHADIPLVKRNVDTTMQLHERQRSEAKVRRVRHDLSFGQEVGEAMAPVHECVECLECKSEQDPRAQNSDLGMDTEWCGSKTVFRLFCITGTAIASPIGLLCMAMDQPAILIAAPVGAVVLAAVFLLYLFAVPIVFCCVCAGRSCDCLAQKSDRRQQIGYTSDVLNIFAPVSQNLDIFIRSGQWDTVLAMFEAKSHRSTQQQQSQLSDLLKHSRSTKCTDERDKIFAFLGLLGSDHNYDIFPDYSTNNNKEIVLTHSVRAIIQCEKSLNIIQQAFGDLRSTDARNGLSSWMPDVYVDAERDKQHAESLRCMQVDAASKDWRASQARAALVSFATDGFGRAGYALVAQGIKVDSLSRLDHDPHTQPWRRFIGTSGLQFGTRNTAKIGDEIWVLLGLDVPLALSRLNKDEGRYTILGCAMIWSSTGAASPLMQGSIIDELRAGRRQLQEITIV